LLSAVGVLAQKGMIRKVNNNDSKECIALVIGNASYKESPLNNPVNDAQDMAKALGELGFTVILKTNASQKDMDEGLDEFTNKLSNGCVGCVGCVGLFYYSGHGVQFEGTNYLISVDANINDETDIKYTSLDVNEIIDHMKNDNKNGMNIIILDACRNNPFSNSRSLGRGLVETKASRGFIIGYATEPGSVAYDGPGRNSVYTKYLLTAMKTPGLKIEDVFKYILEKTSLETKQTPWMSTSFVGDFYFIPPSGNVTPPKDIQIQIPSTPTTSTETVGPDWPKPAGLSTNIKMATLSIIVPGLGQLYGKRYTSGTLFGLIGVWSETAFGIMWSMYAEAIREYNSELKRYQDPTITDTTEKAIAAEQSIMKFHDKKLRLQRQQQVWGITAGSILTINVFHALIAGPSFWFESSQAKSNYHDSKIISQVSYNKIIISMVSRF
jgi:hypothetical protein